MGLCRRCRGRRKEKEILRVENRCFLSHTNRIAEMPEQNDFSGFNLSSLTLQ